MTRYAVVFPGQGSQFSGMADPWVTHPAGQTVIDEASGAMGRDVLSGCRDEDALATTEFLQPALLACDVAAFRVLQANGLADVVGVAGHSLGEFAALVAAQAISLPDALRLVVVRATAMQTAGEARPGAMTALLGIGGEDAEALCAEARGADELVVANLNSPAQSVVSGDTAAVDRLESLAKERRVRAVRLPVAGAFHSELMRSAAEPVLEMRDQVDVRDPAIPVAENVTGELVTDASRLRELVGMQVVSPVRWEVGIRNLIAAGADTFLEAGVGDVLTKLMKRIDAGIGASAIGSPESAREAMTP